MTNPGSISGRKSFTADRPDSILGFQTTGGGSWPVWDRFLAVGGENIYHLGNICGTCQFMFKKLKYVPSSFSPSGVAAELNTGIQEISPELLEGFALLLPQGKYEAVLRKIKPVLAFPGSENDYFTTDLLKD